MRLIGVKRVDPVLDSKQVDWMVVAASECPDAVAERNYVERYFRKPHEPWGDAHAFVLPVKIRRSRRRVLFTQISGMEP